VLFRTKQHARKRGRPRWPQGTAIRFGSRQGAPLFFREAARKEDTVSEQIDNEWSQMTADTEKDTTVDAGGNEPSPEVAPDVDAGRDMDMGYGQ
jgi:hypothetical protein